LFGVFGSHRTGLYLIFLGAATHSAIYGYCTFSVLSSLHRIKATFTKGFEDEEIDTKNHPVCKGYPRFFNVYEK
jgi:hypothetical protein